MAIERISELDQVELSEMDKFKRDDDDKKYDEAKLSVGLFMEVSIAESLKKNSDGQWYVEPTNEAKSYFLSKKIPANYLEDVFGTRLKVIVTELSNMVSTIISGPINNFYGYQNFGNPDLPLTDSYGHTVWYDNELSNHLCVMVSADFTNKTNFHNNVEFHNKIFLYDQLSSASDIFCQNITINNDANIKGDTTINGTLSVGNNDANGDIYCQTLHGTATRAQWADLAEYYESDKPYSPGTLIKFGGDREITIADTEANAVVTTNPGFVLNSEKENKKNYLGVALIGRVPVRVIGKVNKFDRISLSEIPGVGVANPFFKSIGLALESSGIESEKLVECLVKLII